MMSQAISALLNAARLKGMDSPSNFSDGAPSGASPLEIGTNPTGGLDIAGGAPSAFDQVSGERNLDSLAASLHNTLAGRAADRRQTMSDDVADLDSGLPRHIAIDQQGIRNDVQDKAAAGEYMPFTQQLHDRTQAEKSDFANTQYVMPSILKAQADLQGHQIDAQGKIAAAQAGHPAKDPMDYFRQAVAAAFGKGLITKPEDLVTLAQQLGVKQ